MRIRPRPPAEPRRHPGGEAGGEGGGEAGGDPAAEARARAEALWALVLRRFYDHVHRGGQEEGDDHDRTR